MPPLHPAFCLVAATAALVLVGCGEAPAPLMTSHVSFKAHPLLCTPTQPLEAWLRVAGVEGACPLDVAPDLTVSGACSGVPAHAVREFRLEYFFVLNNERIALASASVFVDLRDETRGIVPVDFGRAPLETNLDDDGDEMTNLEEFCAGRNPRDANG